MPDIIVGVLTAGVGVIGLKALQALNVSQKVATNVIRIGKLVGESLKLLTSSTEIVLTRIAGGAIVISGRAVKALVGKLDDLNFEKLLGVVNKVEDKTFLTKFSKVTNGLKNIKNPATKQIKTGRIKPDSIEELIAMKSVWADPMTNSTNLSNLPKKPIIYGDTKNNLLAKDGWEKWAKNVNGIEIHFGKNKITMGIYRL